MEKLPNAQLEGLECRVKNLNPDEHMITIGTNNLRILLAAYRIALKADTSARHTEGEQE